MCFDNKLLTTDAFRKGVTIGEEREREHIYIYIYTHTHTIKLCSLLPSRLNLNN